MGTRTRSARRGWGRFHQWEELGDPERTWRIAQARPQVEEVYLPGDPESHSPQPTAVRESTWGSFKMLIDHAADRALIRRWQPLSSFTAAPCGPALRHCILDAGSHDGLNQYLETHEDRLTGRARFMIWAKGSRASSGIFPDCTRTARTGRR